MPVRIYSFAKDLGIDNKKLLEVCERIGLKGKGSALATLTDEEAEKLKQYINGQGQEESAAPAASQKPIAPSRNDPANRRSGPLRDLNKLKKKAEPPKEEPAAPEPTPEVVAAPAVEEKGKEKVEPPKPERPAVREQRVIRELDRPGPAKSTKPKPREPKKPTVRVAQMPNVKQPSASKTQSNEKVQKPDIALPQDAIRRAKSGAAPLQQFTDSKKSKDSKDRKKGKGFTPAPQNNAHILGEMPSKGKDKKRRGERGKGSSDEIEMGSTRQARRTRRKPVSGDDDRPSRPRRSHMRRRGPVANTAAPRKDKVVLELPCTVRTFSEAAGVGAGNVVKALMEMGVMANINAVIEDEMAEMLAEHLGVELDIREQESLEDKLISKLDVEDAPDSLSARPPVVTFLGHVDHGKTSLLDALIGIDVVSGEAGGITQHIRAYEIDKDGQKIAFVDTPGHEAFTEMRARGANVTDIAVLVVAADDGVMPQTEEAISHAKAAGVPIIVALNKIDLPSAQPDKALQDLAQHELLPSEWGGEIEVVRTSATNGEGLDVLLETILVTAELHEYNANPDRNAVGTCLEAEQEPGRGVIAKVIVQNGTLKVGDVVVCGAATGRVKALYDTLRPNRKLMEAGPSVPVNLTGLDVAPEAGDKFYVLDDIADAREIAESRLDKTRQESLSGITTRVSLDDFQQRLESGNLVVDNQDVVTLNLILRADVRGSIEAIQKELGKLDHPEVDIRIMQALVGGITVADVRLAQASQAVIIGFNVVPDEAARSLADDLQVEIRRYDIIYKVTDDIKATLEGRLKPEEQVVELGMAMVLRTFDISKSGRIAGCRVMRGNIERGCRLRVIRDSRVIGDYEMDSLKREKDDAKTVQRGMECGIKLSGFNDVKEGDQLEAYKIEEVARTL